eukprot:359240-Chlamydomonas_euryale.AAC.15
MLPFASVICTPTCVPPLLSPPPNPGSPDARRLQAHGHPVHQADACLRAAGEPFARASVRVVVHVLLLPRHVCFGKEDG